MTKYSFIFIWCIQILRFFLEKIHKIPFILVYFSLFPFILVYCIFDSWSCRTPAGLPSATMELIWPRDILRASAWTGGVYPRLYSASIAIRVTERLMAEMPAGESTFPGPWWLDALVNFGSAVTLAHSNCGVGVAGTFHLAILVLGGCRWVIPTPWRDLGGHLELCRTRNQN